MSLDKNSLESVSEVDKRTNFWYFCFVVRVDHRDCYHWKSFFFFAKNSFAKAGIALSSYAIEKFHYHNFVASACYNFGLIPVTEIDQFLHQF